MNVPTMRHPESSPIRYNPIISANCFVRSSQLLGWLFKKSILTDFAVLIVLTFVGLGVHGYHLGLEDEAVYLPAIKSLLDRSLFPHDSMFFLPQMKFTLYNEIIAFVVRLSHLRIEAVIFAAYLVSVFLVLAGCLRLSRKLFAGPAAQWASVTLIAALMTMPVTGTALLLVDQYLHPRSFATAFILFALVEVLDRRLARAACWLLFAAVISPLMALQGVSFAALLAWRGGGKGLQAKLGAFLAAVPVAQSGAPIWDQVTCSYYYLLQWKWYELLGVVAPLVILWAFSRMEGGLPSFRLVSRRISIFGLVFAAISLAMSMPLLERFLGLQPMRSFHLVYLVLMLCCGGLVGEKILKNKPLRWMIFFLPFCIGMFAVQRYQFSSSDHIEWPGMEPRNQWVQAFNWVRENTPKDVFFALDPYFMETSGAEFHGFRALAERSMMPDLVKDPVVVSVLFAANKLTSDQSVDLSGISTKWYEQATALRGWKNFGLEDFQRLKERFGVTWVVLEKPGITGLSCPYENAAVMVCHID